MDPDRLLVIAGLAIFGVALEMRAKNPKAWLLWAIVRGIGMGLVAEGAT